MREVRIFWNTPSCSMDIINRNWHLFDSIIIFFTIRIHFKEYCLWGAVFGLQDPPNELLLNQKGVNSYLFYPWNKMVCSKKSLPHASPKWTFFLGHPVQCVLNDRYTLYSRFKEGVQKIPSPSTIHQKTFLISKGRYAQNKTFILLCFGIAFALIK